jgi:hypothetical protein
MQGVDECENFFNGTCTYLPVVEKFHFQGYLEVEETSMSLSNLCSNHVNLA